MPEWMKMVIKYISPILLAILSYYYLPKFIFSVIVPSEGHERKS